MKKDNQITTRLPTKEAQEFYVRAAKAGLSRSALVRRVVMAYLKGGAK